MSEHHYDVLVIGGGPAGSTAAALLAESGRRVLLLEKDRFPRYRVGESLMPFCYFTLERLGVLPKLVELGFTRKYSVQFVGEAGKVSKPFYFFQHYKHPSSTTWQVLRSEFDLMLLDNARRKGATVREGIRVRDLIRDGDGRTIGVRTGDNGGASEFFAPVTIDASGRDALAQTKNQWRIRDPGLNKIALWTYYRHALRDPGLDEGSTTVAYLPGKGWFWYIPLHGDYVSTGIVADRDYLYRDSRDPKVIFEREIGHNAWIRDHLAPGEPFGRHWTTGEYSYRARHCAADGLVLAGDAFSFLDPVFSSGVFLALKSGELAADAVNTALDAGDCSAQRFQEYGETLCQGIEAMRNLVYAFYEENFSFRELIMNHPDVQGDLTDCLIGDLFKDFGRLFEAVGTFARPPEALEHGLPKTTTSSPRDTAMPT